MSDPTRHVELSSWQRQALYQLHSADGPLEVLGAVRDKLRNLGLITAAPGSSRRFNLTDEGRAEAECRWPQEMAPEDERLLGRQTPRWPEPANRALDTLDRERIGRTP